VPDLAEVENLAALVSHRRQIFDLCQIFRQIWR
jgi:hypothetical protein